MIKKMMAVGTVILALMGCEPKAGGGSGNQPPAGAGGDSRGYTLLLQVLDRNGHPASLRNASCTIVGYAGDKVVTVDGQPYSRTYNDIIITSKGYRLRIYDYANVVTIEFLCTVEANPGEEFLCTVTTASGAPARFIGEPLDRNIVDRGDDSTLCSGTINARS